jgi:predicted transcriptional regulator of viral defense system
VSGRHLLKILLILAKQGKVIGLVASHYLLIVLAGPKTVTNPTIKPMTKPTIEERILKHMKWSWYSDFTADDLVRIGGRKKISAVLSKLATQGKLTRIGSGRYILPGRESRIKTTTEEKILKQMKWGWYSDYTVEDLKHISSEEQLSAILPKLVKKGELKRAGPGRYVLPGRESRIKTTAEEKILKRMKKGRYSDYTAEDLLKIAPEEQISAILPELVKKGELKRVAPGRYILPGRESEIEPTKEERILNRMKEGTNRDYTSKDLIDIGTEEQISAILPELEKKGELIRVAPGRYVLPGREYHTGPKAEEKILNRLKKIKKSDFTAMDLLDLQIGSGEQINAVLSKLNNEGKLIRFTAGRYALADRPSEAEPPLENEITKHAEV